MSVIPKMIYGRRGLPREALDRMYADYLRLHSLRLAGALHDRSRQSMFCIFKTAGLPLYARNFHDQIEYRGRRFTPGKDGYLRDTVYRRSTRRETLLHRIIWEDHNGPIPPGHEVTFIDADKRNYSIRNLLCLNRTDMRRRNNTGANHFTKTSAARLKLLLGGKAHCVAKLRRAG